MLNPNEKIDPTKDLLAGLPVLGVILEDLRKRILKIATQGFRLRKSDSDILRRVRMALDDVGPKISSVLSDVQLIAWMRGLKNTSNQLPSFSKPIQAIDPVTKRAIERLTRTLPAMADAANSLLLKGLVTPQEILNMDASLRHQNFWLSGVSDLGLLGQIRDALVKAVAQGTGLDQFREDVASAVEGSSSVISPVRVETIYRTSVQNAYKEGRRVLETNPVVAAALPYKIYHAIHDSRVRHDHLLLETLGLNGTNIYRADDPMWELFDPPWDFNCRCTAVLISIRRAAEYGVREAQLWLESGQPPLTPEWRIEHIPFRPSAAWVA